MNSSLLDRQRAEAAYAALKQRLDAVIAKAAEAAEAARAKYQSLFEASQAGGGALGLGRQDSDAQLWAQFESQPVGANVADKDKRERDVRDTDSESDRE